MRRRLAWVVMMVLAAGVLGIGVPSAAGSCAGPVMAVGAEVDVADPPTTGGLLRRSQSVTVTGEYFHSGCADTIAAGPGCSGSPAGPTDPEAPLADVRLTLHQGSRMWVLDTADATGERYAIRWRGELPSDAATGPAELRAGSASLPVMIGS